MADINSYALSIELTLQSNAEQVLAGVVGQIGVVEARVQNMVQNLGNSLNQFSTQLTQNMSQLSSAVSTMGQNVNSINLAAPVQGMAVATIQAQQAVQNLSNQFQLPVDLVNKLRDAMIAVSVVDWKEDENVGEVIKQYQYLTNTALPGLQKIREHIASQGKTLSAEEIRLAQQIGDMQMQVLRSRQVLENQYHRLRTKWSTMTKAQFKDEILSQKEINKLTKEQVDTYKELMVVGRARARTQEAIADPTQQIAANKETQKFNAVLGGLPSSVDKIGDKFSKIKGIISDVGAVIGRTLSTIGLGPIVQAASATGLYATGVQRAADREEQLHAISLRSLGSMGDLSNTIRQTSSETGLLTSELTTSSIALRDAGFSSAEQVKEMSQYTAMLERTTGASVDVTAKFAKTLAVVGKNEAFATKQMFLMQRAAKAAGFSGSDLNAIMGRVSENAQLMGTQSPAYTEKFTKSLINSANAAKKLGLNVNDAIAITERMQDPLESVGLLGREAFDIWTDPEEMQQRLAEVAKQHLAHIDSISSGAQKWRSIQRVGALMGMEGAPAAAVLKNLRLLAAGSEDVAGTLGETQDPAAEMNKALMETSTIVRRTAEFIEKVLNRIEAFLTPIKDLFEGIYEWAAKSNVAQTLGEWGLYAGAAASGFISLGSAWLKYRTASKVVTIAAQGYKALTGAATVAKAAQTGATAATAANTVASTAATKAATAAAGSLGQAATKASLLARAGGTILKFAGRAAPPLAVLSAIKDIYDITDARYQLEKSIAEAQASKTSDAMTLLRAREREKELGQAVFSIEDAKRQAIKDEIALLVRSERAVGNLSGETKQILELRKELMDVTEKMSHTDSAMNQAAQAAHGKYQAAIASGDVQLAKRMALQEASIKKGADFAADKEGQTKALAQAETDINNAIAERVKKMKSAIDVERIATREEEKQKIFDEMHLKDASELLNNKELLAEADKRANAMAQKRADSYDPLTGLRKTKQPEKSNSIALQLAEAEREWAKGTIEMPQVEKGMPDMSAAISDVAKIAQKTQEPAPVPIQDMAKAAQKALDGSKAAVTAEDIRPIKAQPKPESIVPVKHTDQTARPIEKEDTVSPAVAKTNQLIEGIIRKIGESKLGEVVKILEDNLPKLVEASNPGLAPAANQWIN
jgi:hypothetical protein